MKIIPRKVTIINSRVNYFEAARMIQTKIGAQQDFKHLIRVRFYFHPRKPLKKLRKDLLRYHIEH